jgi:DHA1 family multidrug resistance protein-like MFS transporter
MPTPRSKQTTWRRNFRAIWIAELLAIMGFSSNFPIYTYYIQSLGVNEQLIARWSGIVLAASSLSMGVMAPIWGALGDRRGRKIMVMRAMFGGSVVIGLMGFVQSVEQFALLRLIQGGLTGTVTAATALVAGQTPDDKLGETMGKLQLAIFLGQSVGPITGGFVADLLGYRATFWMTAIYLVAAGLLILTRVDEEFTLDPTALEESLWSHLRGDFSVLFGVSTLALVLGLRFALRVGLRMRSPTLPLIVQEVLPSGTFLGSASGSLTTISGISSALTAPLIGRRADRHGGRLLLMGSAMVAAVAMLFQAMTESYWILLLAQVFLGFGIGGTLAVTSVYIAKLAPRDRTGAAFGLNQMAKSLSNAVGPTVGGWLGDTFTNRIPLYAGGICMTLAGAAVMLLPGDKQQVPEDGAQEMERTEA